MTQDGGNFLYKIMAKSLHLITTICGKISYRKSQIFDGYEKKVGDKVITCLNYFQTFKCCETSYFQFLDQDMLKAKYATSSLQISVTYVTIDLYMTQYAIC